MSKKNPDAYTETEAQGAEEAKESVESEASVEVEAEESWREGLPAPTLEAFETELEEAYAEAADNRDMYLRAKAESDNIRRRTEIDIANAHKYAIDKFATEILAVRDSMELARTADVQADNEEALEKMHEGLDMTLQQLDSVFQKFNLRIIDPEGEKFDPEQHQAISMVESDEVEPNHILTVVQKGCWLNERLLRPAMVVVAKA